jgi:hypothetical protein
MEPTEKTKIDDWADSIDCDAKQVLLKVLILIEHTKKNFHEEGKGHGNIRPESILIIGTETIDLEYFDQSQGFDYESPYASPDNRLRDTTASKLSDIYSICAVCYRLLSGQSPVKASTRARRANGEILFPENMGNSIKEVISKGLSIDPSQRPQNLDELRILIEKTVVDGIYQESASDHPTDDNLSKTAEQSSKHDAPCIPTPVKRLPTNLTSGQESRLSIDSVVPDRAEWKISVIPNDALAVVLEEETNEFVFQPSQPGEHTLTIELQHPDITGRPALQKTVAVTVNPDPDSLWLNKPSDTNQPYYKKDTDAIEVVTPFARILAASQRGRSHAHEGSCRDDDFLVKFDEVTGWHLLTAADGAGSAKFSRQGSLIACTKAIEHMTEWLNKESDNLTAAASQYLSISESEQKHLRNCAYAWLGGAAFESLKAIKAEADRRDPPAAIRDFHTTLLLAAAKETPSGWLLITFSIGDGGIAAVSRNGNPVSLCTPDSGEFSGQTVFLTAPGVLRSGEDVDSRIHIRLVPDLLALFLLTDGITDPKFPTEASFVEKSAWSDFLHELNDKVNLGKAKDGADERLLSWLSFRSPGNHDDRTIVVLLNEKGTSNDKTDDQKVETAEGFLSRLLGGRRKISDSTIQS